MEVSDLTLLSVKDTPSTYWIGGSVGPQAGLDEVMKRKSLQILGIKP
jgi:hypothetical protein